MITSWKQKSKNHSFMRLMFLLGIILTFLCVAPMRAAAVETTPTQTVTTTPTPGVTIDGADDSFNLNYDLGDGTGSLSSTLQILLLLTVISLAPSILIMMTSFIRSIIVLHFVRSALGTQTTPPNQVLIGLALFLTLFIMSPIFTKINAEALQPLNAGEITQEEAFTRGLAPIRDFMFDQVDGRDLNLFLEISGTTGAEIGDDELTREDIPTTVLIPSFILSELRYAFIIGFLIYLPFIVIDMVVASTLMSMGMMMLPPTTISMPFKILLFVLADGWNLVIGELVKTFY